MAYSLRNTISNEIAYNKEAKEAHKPCFKHAAESLSQASSAEASSEPEMCEGCSKTMLSYINLIQNMLYGLARKVSKCEDPTSCGQCQKQEYADTENLLREEKLSVSKTENLINLNGIVTEESETLSAVSTVPVQKHEIQSISSTVSNLTEITSEPKKARKISSRRNSRRISREMKENGNEMSSESSGNRNNWQTDFLYNVSSSVEPKYIPYYHQQENENLISATSSKRNSLQDDISVNHKGNASAFTQSSRSNSSDTSPLTPSSPNLFSANFGSAPTGNSENSTEYCNSNKTKTDYYDVFLYSATANALNLAEADAYDSAKSDYSVAESNSSHIEADIDDYLKSDYSGTESVDRKLNDITITPAENEITADQNLQQWMTLYNSFSDRVTTATDRKSSEAFVTICRNNAEALGCLVLGSSLLLSRTSRKLCVLVFDNVDLAFKEPLSSVFHVVQHVRHLRSIDERKLEYLKQMNLEKLCIWCLVEFSKCVFLNPDCLIIRNCDELFQHEEMSAVPDVGWPDCFNAGVFVFMPSIDTLSKLVELSQKEGQNNEGDQTLLNAYFNSWSSDIGKKLSFIYNLMRNSSYTYGPAFQRFGHNVKIVQFLGGSKPWEVKFFTGTGQLDGDLKVHPQHVRFFAEWINTFKIAVLKLLPQDVYTYALNQRSISAEDIGLHLCFPSPCKYLDKNVVKSFHFLPKRQAVSSFCSVPCAPRKTAECNISPPAPICCPLADLNSVEEATENLISIDYAEQNGKIEAGVQNGNIENETVLNDSPSDRCLPGAIIGDYQGMMAWEQGHIDYEGCDSSENIMNRLSFLIHRSVPPNL